MEKEGGWELIENLTKVKVPGIWGLCGRDAEIIHFCTDGKSICRRHPILKFPLPNWNPENDHTCKTCKSRYIALLRERAGMVGTT
jgi:hypothetical protein